MTAIASVSALELSDVGRVDYSALMATVGYESRARYASEHLGAHGKLRTAGAFSERQVLAFAENLRWFKDAGYDVPAVPDSDAERWFSEWLSRILTNDDGDVRILFDISSMSRLRLASFLAAIIRAPNNRSIEVDFVYSMAKWSAPSEEPEAIVTAGSVLPCFAGWSDEPDLPIVAILGLGYEPGMAVGAYEYLEATSVWAFVPVSSDPCYTRDIKRANESLLRRVPPNQVIRYAVDQPFACFQLLESIAFGANAYGRPVLLPFGPKVFALCSLLVACRHRTVPVWRISSGQFGEPSDRVASGQIVGLRVSFDGLKGS